MPFTFDDWEKATLGIGRLSLETITALLDVGADIDASDKDNEIPLHYAYGHTKPLVNACIHTRPLGDALKGGGLPASVLL